MLPLLARRLSDQDATTRRDALMAIGYLPAQCLLGGIALVTLVTQTHLGVVPDSGLFHRAASSVPALLPLVAGASEAHILCSTVKKDAGYADLRWTAAAVLASVGRLGQEQLVSWATQVSTTLLLCCPVHIVGSPLPPYLPLHSTHCLAFERPVQQRCHYAPHRCSQSAGSPLWHPASLMMLGVVAITLRTMPWSTRLLRDPVLVAPRGSCTDE